VKLNKEVKVGLLATVALTAAYLGVNFLKSGVIFSSSNRYHTVYANSTGLNIASPVLLNGVTVGKIIKLQILPDEDYSVRVTFETQKNIRLTDATEAWLISPSLLGEKAIDLHLKEGSVLKDHDVVLSKIEPSFGEGLLKGTHPAMRDVEDISLLTNQFLTNLVENIGRINSIATNLDKTVHKLRQTVDHSQQKFYDVGRNLVEISNALADGDNGVQPLLKKLNQLMNGLQGKEVPKLSAKVDLILGSALRVLNRMEQGDSNLGQLLEDDSLYHNLNRVSQSLDELLVDLKAHPWRYINFSVFGKKKVQESAQQE